MMLAKFPVVLKSWYRSHIRNQVFAVISLLMLLVSIAIGVVSWASTELAADSFINQKLKNSQYALIQRSLEKGVLTFPDTPYLSLYLHQDATKPNYLNELVSIGFDEFEYYNVHVATFHSPINGQLAHLLYFPERDSDRVPYGNDVLHYVLLIVVIVLLLGLLVARYLSHLFTAPVLELERQINQSSLSRSAVCSNRHDELGRLSVAYQRSFQRIQEFVAREKDFTQYASHELRTPVNIIQGAVELLKMTETKPKKQQVLARIEKANLNMNDLIYTFLLLGRESEHKHQAKAKLAATLKESIEQHRHLLSGRDISLRCNSIAGHSEQPAHFSKIVFANLIRNAFSYSDSKVRIELTSNRIVVSNDILQGSQSGFGYGTRIVHMICACANWRYRQKINSQHCTTVVYFNFIMWPPYVT